MTTEDDDGVRIARLGPGEIALGQSQPCGHVPYVRRLEDGELESGYLAPTDAPDEPGAAGIIEMGPQIAPGVRTVRSYVPFTARGPAQVASDAYRSGWEGVFGRRSRAGREASN